MDSSREKAHMINEHHYSLMYPARVFLTSFVDLNSKLETLMTVVRVIVKVGLVSKEGVDSSFTRRQDGIQ
jgi:hypothetical protein